MCIAGLKAFNAAYEQDTGFELATMVAKATVQEVVKGKMRLFGSSGKA